MIRRMVRVLESLLLGNPDALRQARRLLREEKTQQGERKERELPRGHTAMEGFCLAVLVSFFFFEKKNTYTQQQSKSTKKNHQNM